MSSKNLKKGSILTTSFSSANKAKIIRWHNCLIPLPSDSKTLVWYLTPGYFCNFTSQQFKKEMWKPSVKRTMTELKPLPPKQTRFFVKAKKEELPKCNFPLLWDLPQSLSCTKKACSSTFHHALRDSVYLPWTNWVCPFGASISSQKQGWCPRRTKCPFQLGMQAGRRILSVLKIKISHWIVQ